MKINHVIHCHLYILSIVSSGTGVEFNIDSIYWKIYPILITSFLLMIKKILMFFSNINVASAILSAVKQSICMEASLKYMMKNADNFGDLSDTEAIQKAFADIESNLRRLKRILEMLENRAIEVSMKFQLKNIVTHQNERMEVNQKYFDISFRMPF